MGKETRKIEGFVGHYRFLSNFYPTPVKHQWITWPTLEHAYQYEKLNKQLNEREMAYYMAMRPGRVKQYVTENMSRTKAEWDLWLNTNEMLMRVLICAKFPIRRSSTMTRKLLETDDAYLEETNTWGDEHWGVCNGKGLNKLGKILMERREDINKHFKALED